MVIAHLFACSGGAWAPLRDALDRGRFDVALRTYDEAAEREGHDPEVVVELAVLLLRQSIQSGDRRLQDAAVVQLRMAGSRGRVTLRGLLPELEPGLAQLQVADALVSGVKEQGQRRVLQNLIWAYLASNEPAIQRISLRHARAGDRAVLERALRSAEPTVRAAALRRLGGMEPQAWMLSVAQKAIHDTNVHVRRAAVKVLDRAGEDRGVMFALFADADPLVRLETLRILSSHNDLATDQALLRLLAAQLVWPPSSMGVAAAQVLSRRDPLETHLQTSPIAAVEYLQRVLLESGERDLRAQAAVALILVEPGLPLRHFVSELLARLPASERDLRLQLARVLLEDEPARPRAFSELQVLLDRCDVPGVQAAALLAQQGEGALGQLGAEMLGRCVSPELAPDTTARRTAARSLAADAGLVSKARACLSDPDPIVRIFCAGGIVARAQHLD